MTTQSLPRSTDTPRRLLGGLFEPRPARVPYSVEWVSSLGRVTRLPDYHGETHLGFDPYDGRRIVLHCPAAIAEIADVLNGLEVELSYDVRMRFGEPVEWVARAVPRILRHAQVRRRDGPGRFIRNERGEVVPNPESLWFAKVSQHFQSEAEAAAFCLANGWYWSEDG